jgi:hypothetical protein
VFPEPVLLPAEFFDLMTILTPPAKVAIAADRTWVVFNDGTTQVSFLTRTDIEEFEVDKINAVVENVSNLPQHLVIEDTGALIDVFRRLSIFTELEDRGCLLVTIGSEGLMFETVQQTAFEVFDAAIPDTTYYGFSIDHAFTEGHLATVNDPVTVKYGDPKKQAIGIISGGVVKVLSLGEFEPPADSENE